MTSLDLLTVLFGMVIGYSLGLTGGGGSIFAVPMLIYGLGTGAREAVAISLAVVGATSLLGAALRWHAAELERRGGIVFAMGGLAGAPFGTAIGHRLPETLTLICFALLMACVGFRMWRGQRGPSVRQARLCSYHEDGSMHLTAKCVAVLLAAGLLVGILSGIFGVGGGFIIVPVLVFVTGIPIHRAVSTSLLVIAVICASGVISNSLAGQSLPVRLTSLFILGGFLGMIPGVRLRSRLSGPGLNRVFAAAMWLVAVFLIVKNTLSAG
ncbi:MAG TPA: sulfite exporter TauE/SafE family protein [Verrucomicrobiales bacterium]|nr:sulfite exporter TauE/SafE family protein [Verrucomicrobiales bacterium]